MDYNLLIGKRSWLLAPFFTLVASVILFILWKGVSPSQLVALFDANGSSPVEIMTLALFGAIIPLCWLCPTVRGSWKRKVFWNFVFSVLALMAIIRETDLHKILFAELWPQAAALFKGTVFKMRFLTDPTMPVSGKIFVALFFLVFFSFAVGALARWIWPILKGIKNFHPVAWTVAGFGGVGMAIQIFDRFPSIYRKSSMFGKVKGEALDGYTRALFTAFEEGWEMLLAGLAILAILQAHAMYCPDKIDKSKLDL